MNDKAEALKARTKKFALDVLEFVDRFPTYGPAVRIGNQLAAAATSVAANYRASCRARSKAEFAAKIGVVLEESDESSFWLEVAQERRLGPSEVRQAAPHQGHVPDALGRETVAYFTPRIRRAPICNLQSEICNFTLPGLS